MRLLRPDPSGIAMTVSPNVQIITVFSIVSDNKYSGEKPQMSHKKLCFVIMPFGEEGSEEYQDNWKIFFEIVLVSGVNSVYN